MAASLAASLCLALLSAGGAALRAAGAQMSVRNLSDLKVYELKAVCRAKGLRVSGNKAELVSRIEDSAHGVSDTARRAARGGDSAPRTAKGLVQPVKQQRRPKKPQEANGAQLSQQSTPFDTEVCTGEKDQRARRSWLGQPAHSYR